jgi:hypothetical protein
LQENDLRALWDALWNGKFGKWLDFFIEISVTPRKKNQGKIQLNFPPPPIKAKNHQRAQEKPKSNLSRFSAICWFTKHSKGMRSYDDKYAFLIHL